MLRNENDGTPFLAVMAFWLGAALLFSCQPAQPVSTPAKPAPKAQEPVRGGTLRVVMSGDPTSLDPQAATAIGPAYNLYDPLIEPDLKDMSPTKEGLFKDWAISGDGKVFTFNLREGVKFHDGTDFDAVAVKFNVERQKDLATKSPYQTDYAAVGSVEAMDSLTVRFNLNRPDPLLLPRMVLQDGMVVSPAAVKKYGQDFTRNPVGTGPFRFVEWLPGDRIVLKRFEGHWRKGLPYLDRLIYRIIPNTSTQVANLRTGQADFLAAFPPEQIPLIKNDPALTYGAREDPQIYGVYLNTKRPPFDNKALRQAIALAIDREGIASLWGEAAKVHSSVLHPMTWAYDNKARGFPSRDLIKARTKMAEAGYPAGLKVKITNTNVPTRLRPAEVLQANLKDIDIEAELEALASAAWLSKVAVPGGYYQTSFHNTTLGLSDPGHTLAQMFHSQGSRNYFGPYSNRQLDELIDRAGSTYGQKERTALYQQAANLLVEEAPFIPTHIMLNFVGANKKVRDFVQYINLQDRFRAVWLGQ